MSKLASEVHNSKLMNYINSSFNKLVNSGRIETDFMPNAGYFVFAKIKAKELIDSSILMSGDFFEQQDMTVLSYKYSSL